MDSLANQQNRWKILGLTEEEMNKIINDVSLIKEPFNPTIAHFVRDFSEPLKPINDEKE